MSVFPTNVEFKKHIPPYNTSRSRRTNLPELGMRITRLTV